MEAVRSGLLHALKEVLVNFVNTILVVEKQQQQHRRIRLKTAQRISSASYQSVVNSRSPAQSLVNIIDSHPTGQGVITFLPNTTFTDMPN